MSMQLKDFFDGWVQSAGGKYAGKQWMLSKWEVCDGIGWPPEKQEIMIRTIREGLRLEGMHSLADLGCGGGWIAESLRPYAGSVVGLDFCREMLDIARSTGPGPWLEGAIGRLPFRAESFDRVLSYFVFLNFTDDSFVESALLDMLRVTGRGGVVLIGQLPDASGSKEYDQAKAEYWQYCKASMPMGARNDDGSRAPLRVFDRRQIQLMLSRNKIRYEFRPSFNPFYRPGEECTVPWRFDLVLFKD
ncbi:MAG: class I SAM-dependent methyltransferase [Candidatus Omnitrophica bacterium]|nr:class I SAM-dependent methyltransferase [Candidatus Omnitrophota bacterium]